jgi:hypothetical protein
MGVGWGGEQGTVTATVAAAASANVEADRACVCQCAQRACVAVLSGVQSQRLR